MDKHSIKRQLSTAYRYSYAKLALNYYSLYEMMCEDCGFQENFKTCVGELHLLIQDFLCGTFQIERLETLRNRVIASMEVITAYTDCFQIYEYVLNRMERRFVDGVKITESVEEFTDKLMDYLVTSKDTVIMNDRIQQVLGQLPIRYTKQKFYQLLMDGMSVYIGSEKKSLENMMYALRTVSMSHLPEDMELVYPDLFAVLNQFRIADYLHMEKETYMDCMERVDYVSQQLYQDAGSFMLLQDIINDFYVLLLSDSVSMMNLSEKQTLENIVRGVLNQFMEGNTSTIEDKITELLLQLEGIQENAMERYLSYPILEETSEDPMAAASRKVDKLLAGSPFVSLAEPAAQKEQEIVDRSYLEQIMNVLYSELNSVFSGTSKPVVRAIMAKLLSSLPVVFASEKELRDYIKNSLESCTDMAERETTMELIGQEMVNEDALV